MNTDEITRYIFISSEPEPADLAFVFGTRHEEPLQTIKILYDRKLIPKIILSGGINRITGINEAQQMAGKLTSVGLPQSALILEDKSTNSLENVLFSRDMIEQTLGFRNISKILVVAKHYHARRALMTLMKHFPKSVMLIPIPYPVYGFTAENWYKTEEGKKRVLSEWEKISKYLRQGDLEELPLLESLNI